MNMQELIKAYSLLMLNIAPDPSYDKMICVLTDCCFDLMRHVAKLEEKVKELEGGKKA